MNGGSLTVWLCYTRRWELMTRADPQSLKGLMVMVVLLAIVEVDVVEVVMISLNPI